MSVTSSEHSSLELELRPSELMAQWRRCGLTADFMAGYVAEGFCPSARAVVKNVLSTVINEIIENAAKFSADPQSPVRIAVRRRGDGVELESRNAATVANARTIEKTIEELRRGSPDDLFARRVADGKGDGVPGLGLLIVTRDYGARIDASATPRTDGLVDVHIKLVLAASRIEKP